MGVVPVIAGDRGTAALHQHGSPPLQPRPQYGIPVFATASNEQSADGNVSKLAFGYYTDIGGHTSSSYLSSQELKPHDEPCCDAVAYKLASTKSGAVTSVLCVSGQVTAFPGDQHCANGIVSCREDDCTTRKDMGEYNKHNRGRCKIHSVGGHNCRCHGQEG